MAVQSTVRLSSFHRHICGNIIQADRIVIEHDNISVSFRIPLHLHIYEKDVTKVKCDQFRVFVL
jgi:hypothetical protein